MAYLLTDLLAASVRRYPDRTAIWARGRTLTYRALDEQSNRLAHLLRARGVTKGDRVGMYFPKNVESLVVMNGAGKLGAVYVPLDPLSPAPQRIGYIVANCAMKALITTADRLRGLDPAHLASVEFVLLTEGRPVEGAAPAQLPWSAVDAFPASAPAETHQPTTHDLAYILYTSGSTGQPKGVMLTHENALTFINWCAETFAIRPDDRLSSHAPLHFDLSVFDIYNTLEAGATVYMVPEDALMFPASLAKWIEKHQISVWYSVPSALVQLALHGGLKSRNLEKWRLILFAGEVFPMKYLKQLAQLLPAVELYNLYGPTETNVCTYYRVDRAALPGLERLPIGRACRNTEVFAVDEHDRLAGPGQTGELYVRGPAVTPGYWGDPEKTSKMVVPNPFQPHFEEKAYRTGDLVIPRGNGDYDFVGRRDNQIKSRGYRIELGEIEAALLSHSDVREAAAVAVPDDEVGNRIKAFVVPANGCSLAAPDLQQHCASRIPKYMIPELIEFRDVLPKTSTGKVDRVQLAGRKSA